MVADRAGVVQVPDKPKRLRMLAGLLALPVEVVTPGMADLLDDGCIVERDLGFVIPNFIEAQEATSSSAQRMRDTRERRRDFAAAGVEHAPPTKERFVAKRNQGGREFDFSKETDGHEPQPGVAKRNSQLQDATDGCAREQNVAPYRTVPIYTDAAAPSVERAGRQFKPVVVVGKKERAKKVSSFTTTPEQCEPYEGTPHAQEFLSFWNDRRAERGLDPEQLTPELGEALEQLFWEITKRVGDDDRELESDLVVRFLKDTTIRRRTLKTLLHENVWRERLSFLLDRRLADQSERKRL